MQQSYNDKVTVIIARWWSEHRILIIIFTLGFSSGLPLSLTLSTLQAWFTVSHISVATIGWLTLLGVPYTYKFLWAPLLDRYHIPQIGRRRSWLLITQFCLLIGIALLAFLDPLQDIRLICILALSISFFSASQDSVIDAYRTEILIEQEQGIGSALHVMAYRFAMLVSGGIAFIFADHFGWHITFLCLASLMLLGLMASFFAPEPQLTKLNSSTALVDILKKPLQDFWQRSYSLTILIFIVLYKFGEAFAVSLGTNFLIHGLGFSLTDVGLIYKTVGLGATLLGAYLGGLTLNYLSLYRSLLIFGILQALAILLFACLAAAGKHYLLMILSILAENITAGMATCALMVFFMRLCHQQYTAAQYALFAALSAVGRVFTGPIAGYFVGHFGWVYFFIAGFILTLPGLWLLYYLQSKSADIFNNQA